MTIVYNKLEISLINNIQKNILIKNKYFFQNRKITVPTEESFAYVLEKAKTGNEMAAVQIDEWQRFCTPRDDNEETILKKIKEATKDIFM
jgi:hypothetical protein